MEKRRSMWTRVSSFLKRCSSAGGAWRNTMTGRSPGRASAIARPGSAGSV